MSLLFYKHKKNPNFWFGVLGLLGSGLATVRLAPFFPVVHNPVEECAVVADVVADLFGFDPLVL